MEGICLRLNNGTPEEHIVVGFGLFMVFADNNGSKRFVVR